MARPAQELPSQEAKMPGPVGFIGLGIMGRPMAKHLVKAGHSLVVHDLSQAPVQELVGLGAKSAGSPEAGARQGRAVPPLGPLGSGGFTKLANQIIVAVNLTGLAEALTLAAKAGLDIELTLKALAGGLAGSRCLDQKTPNYLAHSLQPGFKIDPPYKDLGLFA